MTKRDRKYISARKAYRWASKMFNRMTTVSEWSLFDLLPRPIHIGEMVEENGLWAWKIKYVDITNPEDWAICSGSNPMSDLRKIKI